MTTLSHAASLASRHSSHATNPAHARTRRHRQTLAILASPHVPHWAKMLSLLGFNPIRERALDRVAARG